jgi:excisionase family DNA binding protein
MSTTAKEPTVYYTYAEIAKRWKCSKATVRRRIVAGKLETFGTGTFTRITRESVLAYEANEKKRRG